MSVKTITAAQFKKRCLALLDEIPPEGILVTRHGKPVAKRVPIETQHAALIGSLKGKLHIRGDILSTAL